MLFCLPKVNKLNTDRLAKVNTKKDRLKPIQKKKLNLKSEKNKTNSAKNLNKGGKEILPKILIRNSQFIIVIPVATLWRK